MTLRVHVRRRKSFARHGASVAQAARATLTFAGARQAEVTVVLTHEEEIREFNRRYAGEDATTDVLAFGDGSTDPESGIHYLGDVVIAVPVAAQQAAAAGHPLENELVLLTVHGVLHLLGHDHDDPAARARMDNAQQAVLSRLGIGLRRPPGGPMRSSQHSRTRLEAFRHAFSGWWHVLRTQRNAWIHAVASLLVLALAAWLGLDRMSWAVLLLSIGLVWLAEFLNTALEAVVDLASPEAHPLARVGKDVGAAAVLIAAFTAAAVGLLVMGPPLLARLGLP